MASELAVLEAVRESNIPVSQKRNLIRFYADKLHHGGGSVLARAKHHVMGGAHVLRQGGESAIVGGALAGLAVHLPTGLDAQVGSTGKTVPVDAVVAAAGLAGAVFWAHEPMADDLRNAGSAALAIFSYRKTHDFLAARLAAKGQVPGSAVSAQASGASAAPVAAANGDYGFGEDPIVAIARRL